MGKRGPAPKGEYPDKSAVLSTRISSELRERLEKAVEQSGLTLSREIEHRLRRTFHEEDRANDIFGSERNYRLMQAIAISINTAIDPENPDPDADWLDDPVLFEIVRRQVIKLLEHYRPPGATPTLSAFAELAAVEAPAALSHALQKADSTLPLDASKKQHRANLIKAALGNVTDRPTFVSGTADDFRRMAAQMSKGTKPTKPRKRR